MLETFHARVEAGMAATMAGEDQCPCAIFREVTDNGDLMTFLYNVWNGGLMSLAEYLPTVLPDVDPFEAGSIVERLANGPDGTGAAGFGESLRHVIILAAAAGHAAALDTEAGIGQSEPDDLEAFLRSLLEYEEGGDVD